MREIANVKKLVPQKSKIIYVTINGKSFSLASLKKVQTLQAGVYRFG
jgi:hypothetical protein